MLGVTEKLPNFKVTGVKPGFNAHEEGGESAFEKITQDSFPGKWKVIFFYPKDFTFVCPTEIAEFAHLNREFADRDAVVLGGSTDNEHSKLGWRREHPERAGHLARLPVMVAARMAGHRHHHRAAGAELDGDRPRPVGADHIALGDPPAQQQRDQHRQQGGPALRQGDPPSHARSLKPPSP